MNASCLDITPTILHEFGLSAPDDMAGRVISLDGREDFIKSELANLHRETGDSANPATTQGYTQEEEEIIKARLKDLGYI